MKESAYTSFVCRYLETINTPFLPNNTVVGSIFDIRTAGLELVRLLRAHKSYLVPP